MTDWVAWFRYQLQASADGFVWAFSQISPHLRDNLPPAPDFLGTWSPRSTPVTGSSALAAYSLGPRCSDSVSLHGRRARGTVVGAS